VIGVLDLQGAVQEHLAHLQRLGVAAQPVKEPQEFARLAGLIIPGGESTCLRRLLDAFELKAVIQQCHENGMKVWGTCAGAILLANENLGEAPYFGFIDVTVKRNAFGSQLESFHCEAHIPRVAPEPVPLTFIRAPQITRAGADVEVLLQLEGYIAAAENTQVLVTVFHPELTPSLAFHRYFVHKCGLTTTADEVDHPLDSTWTRHRWMQCPRRIKLPYLTTRRL
jgi:5'-phosphate synthase pdxT subunit